MEGILDKPKLKRGKGRPIEKGQVLNPNGRPILTPALREVTALTKQMVAESVSDLWGLSIDELHEITKKTSGVTVGKMVMARILYQAALKGDQARMDAILNRAIGKPKEEIAVDLSGSIGVSREIQSMSDDELRELIRAAAENLKRIPETK